MRELNRFGVTSAIDAGGGFQNYPDDYAVINELHKRGEMLALGRRRRRAKETDRW